MKKYIPLLFLLTAFPFFSAFAATSLWQYSQEQGIPFPSFVQRVELAKNAGISNYKGTSKQNTIILNSLQSHPLLLGASVSTPSTQTRFEDSLAFGISSSATTFTLTSGLDKSLVAIASSTYGFTLDVNTSKEEDVLADCTGKTCTNVTRGLSDLTATTTVSALQFAHSRGAKVTITTSPIVNFLSNILRGKQNLENKLKYSTSISCSASDSNNTICEKAYIDGVAVAGASNANTTTKGIVQEATGAQLILGTGTGSTGARLYVPAAQTASTTVTGQGSGVIPVSTQGGTLSAQWIATSSADKYNWGGTTTFPGGIGIGTTTVLGSLQVASTTASSTFAAGINVTGGCYGFNGACINLISATSTVTNGTSFASSSAITCIDSNGSPTLMKSFIIPVSGELSVSFDFATNTAGDSVSTWIYRNGTIIQCPWTNAGSANSYIQQFENTTGWSANDRVRIFGQNTAGGGRQVCVQNFVIRGRLIPYILKDF